jgi:hypothetical protein
MSNPIDEFLEMKKEAWGAAFMQGAKKGMGALGEKAVVGGGLAGMGLLAAGGAMAIGKIRESISRKNDFKAMMQSDPELRGIQGENKKFFNQAYNSLRRVNPQFGGDPIIAGSYMRKMMANPDAAGLTLAQTVKAPQMGQGPAGFETNVGPFKIGL